MFDPYRKWLGIQPKEQPPNHYRLLGVDVFENDLDVIDGAADRIMGFVRQYQSGEHAADAARILNEVAAARLCLLKPDKKADYDAKLRLNLQKSTPVSTPAAPEEKLSDLSEADLKPIKVLQKRKKKSAKASVNVSAAPLAIVAVLVVVALVVMSSRPRNLPPITPDLRTAEVPRDNPKTELPTTSKESPRNAERAPEKIVTPIAKSAADSGPKAAQTVPPAFKTFLGAEKPVSAVQWSSDGQQLITVSVDDSCRVWSIESGEVANRFPVHGRYGVLAADGEHLVIAEEDKGIVLYRWRTGESVRELANSDEGTFTDICASPTGHRIAVSRGNPGVTRVLDISTGQVVATFRGHSGRVSASCFTGDGAALYTGGDQRDRIMWSVDTGKEFTRWSGEFDARCFDISANGHYFVEAGDGKEVIVRELSTAKILHTFSHEQPGIINCQFLKNSTAVATSGCDRTVRLWNLNDGSEQLCVRGFPDFQYGLAISTTGLLATGSGWNVSNGNWSFGRGLQRSSLEIAGFNLGDSEIESRRSTSRVHHRQRRTLYSTRGFRERCSREHLSDGSGDPGT